MPKQKRPEVLVAGAGPVGQLAALALADRGVAVQLVDEEWKSAGHSYALALHAETLRLFEELGLLDAVMAEALRVRRLELYQGAEKRGEIDLCAAGDPPHLAVVSQSELERILEDALEARGVEVRWNHRLSRFTQEEERVRVVVDELVKDSVGYAVSGTSWLVGKSAELSVPFVIGADGHGSLVRRQMGIPFDEAAPSQQFSVFEFTTDAEVGDAMRLGFDPAGLTLFWPLPGHRCRFSFESPESATTSSRHKDRLVFQFRGFGYHALEARHLHDLLDQRAPWFQGGIKEIHWSTEVRFERRLARRFGEGRLWLVGDAAHVAGPAGVQSMNVGFREARDLTTILHRILRQGASVRELGAYDQDRLAEWRQLLGLTGGLEATTATDPWIAEHRDQLLACLPASGEALAKLVRSVGLEQRSEGVASRHASFERAEG